MSSIPHNVDSQVASMLGLEHKVVDNRNSSSDPVVFFVHGRGGNSSVMWPFSRAFLDIPCLMIFPQAIYSDAKVGGWSWWILPEYDDSTTARPTVSTAELSFASDRLESFMFSSLAYYNASPSQVYGLGFSQGSAVIASVSFRQSLPLNVVAILGGMLPRVLREQYDNIKFSHQKFFIGHGTVDNVIPFSHAEDNKLWLEERGASVTFQAENVGHKIGLQTAKELHSWVQQELALEQGR